MITKVQTCDFAWLSRFGSATKMVKIRLVYVFFFCWAVLRVVALETNRVGQWSVNRPAVDKLHKQLSLLASGLAVLLSRHKHRNRIRPINTHPDLIPFTRRRGFFFLSVFLSDSTRSRNASRTSVFRGMLNNSLADAPRWCSSSSYRPWRDIILVQLP